MYSYFTYAATAHTITEDVTNVFMPTYSTLVLILRSFLKQKFRLFDEF